MTGSVLATGSRGSSLRLNFALLTPLPRFTLMPQLEHIGIAVNDVDAVTRCFEALLGTEPYKAETVSDQQVRTHFLDAGGPKLEFLEALGPDSPVQRFLDRRGEGLHHLAFEVADLAATMEALREAGFELLSEQPQAGADDKQIAFVHPKQTHGVLVEFCESRTPDWTSLEVPRHDGHLSVFERGSRTRPSLLVLHGAAGTTRDETAPLMRRLESSFHLIGVDLSGHGESAAPPNAPLSLDVFAEDARRALDAVDCPRAHVFGFSLGGAAGLHLAHQTPDRVERLALFQSAAQWRPAQVTQMQTRLSLDALRAHSPDRADRLQARHAHPERLFRQLRAFVETLPAASDALMNALPEISTPTLVGAVDRDPLFDLDDARALHAHLPNARLAVLPGERHSLAQVPLDSLAALLKQHYALS